MVIVLITAVFDFVFEFALVGFALKWFIHRYSLNLSFWKGVLYLFLFFIIIRLIYLPALSEAQITFTVNNAELAQTFHLSPNMPFDGNFNFNIPHLTAWFLQALFAAGIAFGIDRSTCKAKTEKAETS
jgi:hypothetical protein